MGFGSPLQDANLIAWPHQEPLAFGKSSSPRHSRPFSKTAQQWRA